MGLVMCFRVICFFKQKTAYDMRISDWSSDVCSSDLRKRVQLALEHQAERRIGKRAQRSVAADRIGAHRAMDERARQADVERAITRLRIGLGRPEIGRASRRDRVCT